MPETRKRPGTIGISKPHTLFLLFVAGCYMIYRAALRDESDTVANFKEGLAVAAGSFLFFAMLQFPDGIFVRPDPVFWRLIKGIGVLYLLFLVFLLFQNAHDTRQLFVYLDPSLGIPLPERDYASDCRVWTPESNVSSMENIYNTFHDEFVPAHFIGWFLKTLMLRDVYLCTFLSVLFEILEYSLAHVLPNFNECWWDHWILDVATCNAAGIFLGMLVLRYLEAKEYHWAGVLENPTSILYQFMPENWTKYRWDVLSSPHRWFGFLIIIVMWAIVELNCFFLKYVLWHPPPHPIVGFRLVIWFFLSLPGCREYYEWVVNPEVIKIGTFAWICFAVAGAELILWAKLSPGQYPHFNGHPPLIVYSWLIVLASLAIFTIFYFYVFKCHLRGAKAKVDKNVAVAQKNK